MVKQAKSSLQLGGGKCSLCGSEGTLKTTCPLNPKSTKPSITKHPKAHVDIIIPHTPTPKASPIAAPANAQPKRRAPAARLLASGAYGCVYRPRLTCKEQALESAVSNLESTGKKQISKLCNTTECASQLKEISSPELKTADPNNKFHIGNPILCTPTKTPRNCQIPEGDKEILIYENGGLSLHQYNRRPQTEDQQSQRIKKTILPGFINLFDGLAVLNSNGYYHRDIKPANITVGDFPDRKPNFRFIDFGLGVSLPDPGDVFTWNIHEFNLYDSSYPYWGLDTYMLVPPNVEIKIERISGWVTDVKKYSNIISFYMLGGLDGTMYTQSTLETKLLKLIKKIRNDEIEAEVLDTAIRQTDIFSLGVSLLDSVYSEIHKDTPLGRKIFKFLQESNILNINPIKRPDVQEFADEYRTFAQSL
jgi:serine/threonine protein kinase